jgi:predicted Ser/Thr protein kinase
MSNLSGIINKRYYIIETVGHGGMTTVYKAMNVRTKEEVAIKVLAPYLALDPIFKARFEREIKVLHDFENSNIVPILDYGEHNGAPYLVMPFFPEGTLADRLRTRSITVEEIGIVINDISHALEYEHNRGIVHRDIKPSNILLDENGRAYLSDFDLIYMQDASQNLTGSAVIGTPAYMSPEQCSSGPIDARSDQYSLAIVLFQLVTGHLPFYADTPIAIALQQINEPLPSPRDFNPEIPPPIENVLLKALSKDPNKRYPSIVAFNQAFQRALRISMIVHDANGSWTAKYYEITQVLSRIQSKAKGWFSGSVLTKRYAILMIFLLLFILPAGIWFLLRTSKESSDTALRATIAAIYTDVVQQGDAPQEVSLLETIVAGTLNALEDGTDQRIHGGTPIPVTGGEGYEATEFSNKDTDFGTMEISNLPENQLTPSSTPDELPTETNTPLSTSRIKATQTLPAGLTPSATLTPQVTWTITPTPSVASLPTATAKPSLAPTFTSTPIPSYTPSPIPTSTPTPSLTPTENVCSNVSLGGFNIKAVEVSYSLTNNSSTSIMINAINLNWPIENQSLKQIQVGGDTVWYVGDDEPPTQVSGIGKGVAAGTSTQIKFTFKRAAAPASYSLEVTLSGGCTKTQ